MLIGEKIKNEREAKGMTLYRLSKDTGIPYTTLFDIESGKAKDITLTNAKIVCKVLKMSIDELAN